MPAPVSLMPLLLLSLSSSVAAAPAAAQRAPLSVLVSLLLVLVASAAMYRVLVRRSTSHRQWVALADWASENRFHFRRQAPTAPPPEPIDALAARGPRVRLSLSDEMTTLLQFDIPGDDDDDDHGSAPLEQPADLEQSLKSAATAQVVAVPAASQWNVLVRRLEMTWKPTGARPAHAPRSLLDLFSLASFPRIGNAERFMIYGIDSAAAIALGNSSARALLPPDVGLLLHGRHLVLDFSSRPFDTIEFNRMMAVADQIVAHLPAI